MELLHRMALVPMPTYGKRVASLILLTIVAVALVVGWRLLRLFTYSGADTVVIHNRTREPQDIEVAVASLVARVTLPADLSVELSFSMHGDADVLVRRTRPDGVREEVLGANTELFTGTRTTVEITSEKMTVHVDY